jgi:acid phosphatase
MRPTLQALWLLGLGYATSVHALEPLEHLGANSPWFAGPNVNKISSDVPDQCSVDQAIYVVRHGSRYPDPGAYAQWQALYNAVCFLGVVTSLNAEFIVPICEIQSLWVIELYP